jgi:hypothetical protein
VYTYKLISETGYGLNQFGKRLDELRISGTGEILGKKNCIGYQKPRKNSRKITHTARATELK